MNSIERKLTAQIAVLIFLLSLVSGVAIGQNAEPGSKAEAMAGQMAKTAACGR